jgi:hypothetical protein
VDRVLERLPDVEVHAVGPRMPQGGVAPGSRPQRSAEDGAE